jgi:hypothetical protein
MKNQFQIQFLHVASRIDGDYIVGEFGAREGGENYEVSKASIFKTSATIYEKEDKLFLKFDFIYSPLKIYSEIEVELYDLISGECIFLCDGLFESGAYSFFIFKNDFIIQGSIKRAIHEGGKRIDLFDYIIYGNIDNELKSKLPWRHLIYEYF